ncbi:dTMP kinase, partial [Pseudomonas sp. HMWF031]
LAKQDESIVVVSAMQPMEKVHQDVIAIINDYVTNTSSESSNIARNESQQGKG